MFILIKKNSLFPIVLSPRSNSESKEQELFDFFSPFQFAVYDNYKVLFLFPLCSPIKSVYIIMPTRNKIAERQIKLFIVISLLGAFKI